MSRRSRLSACRQAGRLPNRATRCSSAAQPRALEGRPLSATSQRLRKPGVPSTMSACQLKSDIADNKGGTIKSGNRMNASRHRGWQLPTAYRVFVALKALRIVNTESTGASAEHPRDHRRAIGLHATAGRLAASQTCRHCCMSATRSKLAASALFALTCP